MTQLYAFSTEAMTWEGRPTVFFAHAPSERVAKRRAISQFRAFADMIEDWMECPPGMIFTTDDPFPEPPVIISSETMRFEIEAVGEIFPPNASK